MSYAILRLEPLKTAPRGKNSLGGALRHLDNHAHTCEISHPERSKFNKDYLEYNMTYTEVKALGNELKAKHNKAVDEHNENNEKKRRHLKSDTYQFFECVMTFSPDKSEKINLEEWREKNFEFIQREFLDKGCILIREKLDCDEKTEHQHYIIASFDTEKQATGLNYSVGNSKNLSQMQDRYADDVAEFGLERGFSRYKTYESIKRQAVQHGFNDDPESVKRFAELKGLEIPKKRKHKPLSEWKKEQERKGMILEEQNERLEKSIENLNELKAEIIRQDIIPEKYIELLERCETYEELFEIGKTIELSSSKGRTMSLTDLLISKYQDVHNRNIEILNDREI